MSDDPMAQVFRALSDPSRRLLLDRLFERDGQTLGELCAHLPDMTRFGVMKHLGVLEAAGIVTSQRRGREKRHYLNPVPIRLIHDRWISKYAEPVLGAMSALKRHLEAPPMETFDHVYSVYIQAPPERVWQAITDGDDTVRYYYGTRVSSTWQPGAALVYTYPDGSVAADGTVLEVDRPTALRLSFHPRWDPEIEADGPIELAWILEPAGEATKLTVKTLSVRRGSQIESQFTGGWVHIISGLKTLLETGRPISIGAPG
jgi:uncharacterized protein YndB with AHSA1/START domain/DNA-binding transcriptional ArsR family regulator